MAYAIAHVAGGVLLVDGDEGKIWRTAVNKRGRWEPVPHRRVENPGSKGYLRVTLHVPGLGLVQVMAHNLIWTVVKGPIPDGKELNHKDLCTSNNRISNLEPVTKSENILHSYANGRAKPWSKTASTTWRDKPRVTEDKIRSIVKKREDGWLLKDIAASEGVSVTHAHRLSGRRSE